MIGNDCPTGTVWIQVGVFGESAPNADYHRPTVASTNQFIFREETRSDGLSNRWHCWCTKPVRLRCQEIVTQEHFYAYAAIDVVS
jgi:hypothetical protein